MPEYASPQRPRNQSGVHRAIEPQRGNPATGEASVLDASAPAVGTLPQHDFAQIGVDSSRMVVSSHEDAHEQAADRSADQVTAGGARRGGPRALLPSVRPPREPTDVAPSVMQALAAPGRGLDHDVRQNMEQRLSRDFSGVRIHEGGTAAQSAREMRARAYTVGQDVVFGADQFAPGTLAGQRLLAHELSHTTAQGGAATTWLNRDDDDLAGGGGVKTVSFPYFAVLLTDEVALRSSPSGPHAANRFHNLVASLRRDVALVVEGHTGKWMKVRVESGTALKGTTNETMGAAGLTGYVSAELLKRQDRTPRPAPPNPADYKSLQDFSDAWPDRVTSVEHIEKVWDGQTRSQWTTKALAAAGIDPKEWQPTSGFRKSQAVFQKVYRYYASLYLADNRLKWAAMAKLAGGEVYRGYRDQIVPALKLGEFIASTRQKDKYTVLDLVGDAYQIYSGTLDIRILQMSKAIFMDLAWQHEAFRQGGIKAIAAAHTRGEISDDLLAAWKDIDSGDSGRVNKGNAALLRQEQFEVLQGGAAGKGFYKMIQDIPDNDAIPEAMSEEARSPIPGGKPFKDVVKGGDITTFKDRWKWLSDDMVPAFEKLDPATLQRLVQKSLEELADRKF